MTMFGATGLSGEATETHPIECEDCCVALLILPGTRHTELPGEIVASVDNVTETTFCCKRPQMDEDPRLPVNILLHNTVEFDTHRRTGMLNEINSCMPESEKVADTKYGAGDMKIWTDLVICLPLQETFKEHEGSPNVSHT
jgi:hypothetical protein